EGAPGAGRRPSRSEDTRKRCGCDPVRPTTRRRRKGGTLRRLALAPGLDPPSSPTTPCAWPEGEEAHILPPTGENTGGRVPGSPKAAPKLVGGGNSDAGQPGHSCPGLALSPGEPRCGRGDQPVDPGSQRPGRPLPRRAGEHRILRRSGPGLAEPAGGL